MSTENPSRYDAIVVGGSYAGLSAALQLARARRRLLVIDAGIRRNRFAQASHGFLGQDGRPPELIAAEGRQQLLAYPNVQWQDGSAASARREEGGFSVSMEDGAGFQASYLVLATGVKDGLPAVEGLAERWGRSVFHCPYCHGYELNEGRIGVLAVGPNSMHHALMLPHWGRVTFFINGSFEPDAEQRAALQARGVRIETRRVRRLADTATVELEDDERVVLDGLFTATHMTMASPLAQQLGCELDESPMGHYIRTDALKQTTVPSVFACGDAARMAGNVALAVGDGAQAGASAHRAMLFG
ncbi:NAD(P)/FAD-dependent oxidoreductase [Solimonas sp. SE-A11]|uniref:NAD(P)/FAD-dependent oxidoreductase n=1 Tax=Solimonas sp. SE-A11 TaxID=3054954 RepID=UPI00259C71A6|nr:NAD(P)/FAD-dependent oxidoreductase [Solimonas sp. SE-A11]MDM4768967.1 NAD(P)/FAD-dependent oxidoreductase [Solimonas sp. SE-A11]